MGHWCKICGRDRPNEKFSGKGHKVHVCRQCARLPAEERKCIEEEQEAMGFLSQSNISKRNMSRLRALASSPNPEIAEVARLVLAIGEARPRKRGRMRFLANQHRELLNGLDATGLILVCQ